MNMTDVEALIEDRKGRAAQLRHDLEIFEAETRGMERLRDLLLRVQAPAPSSAPATAASHLPSAFSAVLQEVGAPTNGSAAPSEASKDGSPPPGAISEKPSKDEPSNGGEGTEDSSNPSPNTGGVFSSLRRGSPTRP